MCSEVNAQHHRDTTRYSASGRAEKAVEKLTKKIELTGMNKELAVDIFYEYYFNVDIYHNTTDENLIRYFNMVRNKKMEDLLNNDESYLKYLKFAKRSKIGQIKRVKHSESCLKNLK
jgi:N-glycosylase/DNA lyase